MDHDIHKLSRSEFPTLLREIPDPPQELYVRGNLPTSYTKCLAIVGSRNYSDYGKQSVESLVAGLHGYDIAIISGLALGIDSLAHTAALDAGLYTLAIPGSGIADEAIYPRRHKELAHEILRNGGGILSEFEPTFKATQWSFPMRNRIMAGIAHAVLVIEASQRSGTLITSRLATEYNRDVCAVPGNIFSENSTGPHMLIRLGATPITSSDDLLEVLHIEPLTISSDQPTGLNEKESLIYMHLAAPIERDELIRKSGLPVHEANVILMEMEIKGSIHVELGMITRM